MWRLLLFFLQLAALYAVPLRALRSLRRTIVGLGHVSSIRTASRPSYIHQLPSASSSSLSNSPTEPPSSAIVTPPSSSPIPRLNPDMGGLVKWIEKAGGTVVSAQIIETPSGWRLHNTREREIQPGDAVVEIPKRICIFADGDRDGGGHSLPLLDNASQLMNSLDKKQWRVRLAIALLSERVRPSSAFRTYIRNLPFEFRGMPLFFSSSEFGLLQDVALSANTKARCAFLGDFEEMVLKELHKSPCDPFSGHKADLNALGWGFATAASRASRHPSITESNGHVLIPLLDVPWHSFDPNCEIIDMGGSFVLKAKKAVSPGDELTIDYGPLSNEELLEDYGFTVDSNPHDRVLTSIEFPLVKLARVCMGQGGEAMDGEEGSEGSATRGALADRWLQTWQAQWLRVLRLYGDQADYSMTMRSAPSLAGVDGRLWALLRVLYSRSEDELLSHGYDPFSVQRCGSMLGLERECEVLRTLIGLHAIVLRVYGPDLDDDLHALKTNVWPLSEGAGAGRRVRQFASDDIVDDVHRLLRMVLHIEPPPPSSPTVRLAKGKAKVTATANQWSVEDLIRKEELGGEVTSIGGGYAIAGAASESSGDSSGDVGAGSSTRAHSISGNSNDDTLSPVDECGQQLPLNVRVALLYRVRRKGALCDSIKQLVDAYRRLRSEQGLPDDVTAALGGAGGGREDRITRIRELLDEPGKGSGSAGDGALFAKVRAIGEKWAKSPSAL